MIDDHLWPLAPLFADNEAGIRLYDGPVELQAIGHDGELKASGTLEYRWHAGNTVAVATVGQAGDLGTTARLTVPELGADVEVFSTLDRHSFDGNQWSWSFEGQLVKPLTWSSRAADHVRFDVVGLVQTTLLKENKHWQGRTGRLLLEGHNYRILIVELEDATDRRSEARRTGRGAVTHTGRVDRLDGQPIELGETDDLLHALAWLLSFASGAWVAIVGVTGCGNGGARVWGDWGQPRWSRTSGWRWLGAHHPEALCEIWPEWWSLWNAPAFCDVLRWSVPGYVEGSLNRAGLEVSIPTVFTSLEMLAWHHTTVVQGYSNGDAKDMDAWERLNLLLAGSDIPISVPPQLAEAAAWAAEIAGDLKSPDAPAVLANLRNRIEHPRDTARIQAVPPRVRYELLQVALWWVELVLFRLCGFDGHYLSRIEPMRRSVTDTSRPPWVEEAT